MKSKIVRQLGAMLLAGAMLVTSGNVTTYAQEQTDENVEVDIAQKRLSLDENAFKKKLGDLDPVDIVNIEAML